MKRYNIMFHMSHRTCAAWIDFAPDGYERDIEDYKNHPKIYCSLKKIGWHNMWHMPLEDCLSLEEAKEKCRILNTKYNCYDKDYGLLEANEEVGVE